MPSPDPRTEPAEPPDASGSRCHVTMLSGTAVTVWNPAVDTRVRGTADTSVHPIPDLVTRVELCLDPSRVVVVGRAGERNNVPYLDPACRPTTVVPDTGQSVLWGGDHPDDILVSRGHFTLRGGAGGGIVLTNGVPRRGGGVRPPKNGTHLVAPAARPLSPGEEVVIEPGTAAVIRLPNACVIEIASR